MDLLEAIRNLPPQIREMILKMFISTKIKTEREWGEMRLIANFFRHLFVKKEHVSRWSNAGSAIGEVGMVFVTHVRETEIIISKPFGFLLTCMKKLLWVLCDWFHRAPSYYLEFIALRANACPHCLFSKELNQATWPFCGPPCVCIFSRSRHIFVDEKSNCCNEHHVV